MAKSMLKLSDIEEAASLVRRHIAPTPQIAWPLLAKATGVSVLVKHENHTPVGAFKVRGGITFVDALKQKNPRCERHRHRNPRQSRPEHCARRHRRRTCGKNPRPLRKFGGKE